MSLTLSRNRAGVSENSATIYYEGSLNVSGVTITKIYGKIGSR